MTIEEFRALIGPIASRFSDSYPRDYLNKVWRLWRLLDASELKKCVDEINSTGRPVALEAWAMKALNRLKIRPKPEHEEDRVRVLPAPDEDRVRTQSSGSAEAGSENKDVSEDQRSKTSTFSKRIIDSK